MKGNSGQDTAKSFLFMRLEAESKKRHIKHYSFNSFDGMSDLEEHLSYFDQLALYYEYNDLTRHCFFIATFRGGALH